MPKTTGVSIKGTRGNDVITVVSNGILVNGVLKAFTPEQLIAGVAINGDAGDDQITGGAGPDQLSGFSGNDTLIGGGGFDRLVGGDGNDTLIDSVDGATFDGGNGIDTLDLSATTRNIGIDLQGTGAIFLDINLYRDWFNVGGLLPTPTTGGVMSIENLRTGSGDDQLTGNSSANVLDGGGGADAIWGRAGNDTLYGGDGNDHLGGEQGSDLLYGGAGADVFWMTTGGGNDTIMDYSAGDRIYFVGVAKPTQWVLSNDGTSLIGTYDNGASSVTILNVTDVNQLIISGQIIGTIGDDTLVSGADYDLIDGREGNDTLNGGAGDDYLIGGAGNDLLNGGAGVDRALGGSGDDRYVVGNYADEVIENAGEGDDLVSASTSYALAGGSEIETLTTTNGGSTAAIDLTGNEYGNSIYGNAGANVLSGLGGADYLVGLEGDDRIDGGTGNDFLRGDSGADRFVFSGAAGNDTIVDFASGTDKIDLTAYGITFAQVASTTSGGDTILSVDSNGDGIADFTITLTGTGAPASGDYLF